MIKYILEVSLYWAIFYVIYLLFLRKMTFFHFNRYYLLCSLLFGMIIPFLPLIIPSPEPVVQTIMHLGAPIYTQPFMVATEVANESGITVNWIQIFTIVYWLGVMFFSIQFITGIWKIVTYYRSGKRHRKEGYTLIITPEIHLPFSFFNWVFWSQELETVENGEEQIMLHEISHVKGWHSVDVMVIELVKIFMWCSPFIYLYKKSIRNIHEYLADHIVLKTTHIKNYGHLLLRQSLSGFEIALANHFIRSQLKNRIAMMLQKPSGKRAMLKYLWIIPALACISLFISAKNTVFQNGIEITQSLEDPVQTIILVYPDDQQVLLRFHTDRYHVKEFLDNNIPHEDVEFMFVKSKSNYEPSQKFTIYYLKQKKELTFKDGILKVDDQTNTTRELAIDVYQDRFKAGREIISYPEMMSWKEMLSRKSLAKKTVSTGEEIFKQVEVMPIFPGCTEEFSSHKEQVDCGNQKMLEYIYRQIRYPALARAAGIQGMCVVRFVVEKDGSLSNFELLRDIGAGCGKESMRVIQAMNEMEQRWIPGRQGGEVVRVQYNIPVRFKLSGQQSVDQVALYPGCSAEQDPELKQKCSAESMIKNIYKNVKYPADARSKGVEGNTQVHFQVKADGSISNIYVYPELHPEISDNITEIFKNMPRWHPAMKDGKPVTSSVKVPFQFKFANSQLERPNHPYAAIVVAQGIERNASKNGFITLNNKEANENLALIIINERRKRKTHYFQGQSELNSLIQGIDPSAIQHIHVKSPDDYVDIREGVSKVIEVKMNQMINTGIKPPPPPPNYSGQQRPLIEEAFKVVEQKPRFPGCEEEGSTNAEKEACSRQKMLEYIYTNIKYPEIAKINGVQGMVVIRFIVEKDGSLSNLEIVRDIGAECGEEALRVVKSMNEMEQRWTPGHQRGHPVRVYYNLPVRFKLDHNASEKTQPSGVAEEIFKVVEQKPRFPGCEEEGSTNAAKDACAKQKMLEYIYKEIQYPKVAKDNGIQGMVVIRFIVEKDGTLSNPEIVRDIGANCGEEALRIVQSMNDRNLRWTPGHQRGQPVRVYYNLPVRFKLDHNASEKTQPSGVVEEIFKVVEQKPRFPGCEEEGLSNAEKEVCAQQKMLEFIFKEIKYPKVAKDNEIQGMVVIRFIVEKDGSLSNLQVVRDIGAECGEEALRVVAAMNNLEQKWTPGYQRGQAVRVQYNLPVRFKLDGKEESKPDTKVVEDENLEPAQAIEKINAFNNTLELKSVKVFPNPTDSKLNVEFKAEAKPITISILDIHGREITRKEITGFSGSFSEIFDLKNEPAGNLILRIVQEGKIYQKSVVLTK